MTGQERLNEWLWSGDQSVGDAMRLIEEAAIAHARTCCRHHASCDSARPKDKARWQRMATVRRERGRDIEAALQAARELVFFWRSTETARGTRMDDDLTRLDSALDRLVVPDRRW